MALEYSHRIWTSFLLIFQISCLNPALANWASWGEWSEGPCSVTCGFGQMTVARVRICGAPPDGCPGSNLDKKIIDCTMSQACGELDCYECNIFRSGKIAPCHENRVLRKCTACMKSYTRISIHDRWDYNKDMTVISRMCLQHHDDKAKAAEGCVYHTNNGGISVLCFCYSDRCNAGVRQGASLSRLLFATIASIYIMTHVTVCQ